MSRDLARERLKSIRSLQGWREAYKVAGLTSEGSDATKRRRLSRLINTKTSGAKKLDSKERQKINRAYRYREKKGTFATARAEKAIKSINRQKAEDRKNIRRLMREGKLTQAQAERRLRQKKSLTDQDKQALEEAFKNAENDSGRAIRAEYAKHMSSIDPSNLGVDMMRRRDKAIRAAQRDSEQVA
jgi:phage-related minor tail protein